MLNIKISTPWKHKFMLERTPNNSGILTNCRFFVDDDTTANIDAWLIWGGIGAHKPVTIECIPQNVFFLTDEAHDFKSYDTEFLSQFSKVFTLREDIQHPNIIPTHELNTWHVNKTYTEVFNSTPIEKTNAISVVSSDLTDLPGHKLRFAFVNKLIGHFKDKLHVYGKGFNPILDKWDALAPYKYSIAIENCVKPGYFTEKLSECYLSHTLPIYYGAPDIIEYFDKNAICLIDPNDYKSSIQTIEKLLDEDPYEIKLPAIIEQKLQFLTKYNVFQALDELLPQHITPGKKNKILINPEYIYQRGSFVKRALRRLETYF